MTLSVFHPAPPEMTVHSGAFQGPAFDCWPGTQAPLHVCVFEQTVAALSLPLPPVAPPVCVVGCEPQPVAPPAIPEPAAWAMMLAGFAVIAIVMRRRRAAAASCAPQARGAGFPLLLPGPKFNYGADRSAGRVWRQGR